MKNWTNPRLVNLDVDVLRTFVLGADLGGFAKAADRVGRSPSAVSLQLRKLEGQVGQVLLRKSGRGLALTEAGEMLLSYARRIVDINDDAVRAFGVLSVMEGWVRIGAPQDFAETWLPLLLGRFQRAHPKVRLEVRIDRGSTLAEAVARGDLDIALTWGRFGRSEVEIVAVKRMVWIGNQPDSWPDAGPAPLALFDDPCAFREAAISGLDAEGRDWRLAFSSSSLAGVWAAVTAGLGLTARTVDGVPAHLHVLRSAGLPPLKDIELVLHRHADAARPPVAALAALMREAVQVGGAKG